MHALVGTTFGVFKLDLESEIAEAVPGRDSRPPATRCRSRF